MYIFFVILIIIASLLMIFAVLAQNPKSGMAANFGASNQVMGVRQTSDFLEKFTWTLAIAIVILSLVASIAMSSYVNSGSRRGDKLIEQVTTEREGAIPSQQMLPPTTGEQPSETPEATPQE